MSDLFTVVESPADDPFGIDITVSTPRDPGPIGIPISSGSAQGMIRDFAQYGDPERGEGKPSSKRKKQPDHNERVKRYWESLGYAYFRVDGWQSAGSCFVRRDLMGIWDGMALKLDCPPVWVQICARDSVATHIKKMCSDELAENHQPRIANLRFCLGLGHRCVIYAFDQPDGRLWRGEVKDVTNEMIEQVLARRRKK